MACPHEVLELAPIREWGAMPSWICTACHERNPVDCDHARQEPTSTGWQCITCRRTVLGPLPEPHPASRR